MIGEKKMRNVYLQAEVLRRNSESLKYRVSTETRGIGVPEIRGVDTAC